MADGKVQIWQGKVLIRNGRVATSEACCCSGGTYIFCGGCKCPLQPVGEADCEYSDATITFPENDMDNKSVCLYFTSCDCDTIEGDWILPTVSGGCGWQETWNGCWVSELLGYRSTWYMEAAFTEDQPELPPVVTNGYWYVYLQFWVVCVGISYGQWARWETAKHTFTYEDELCPWAEEDGSINMDLADSGISPYNAAFCAGDWPETCTLSWEML